jgi:hypothetical protein
VDNKPWPRAKRSVLPVAHSFPPTSSSFRTVLILDTTARQTRQLGYSSANKAEHTIGNSLVRFGKTNHGLEKIDPFDLTTTVASSGLVSTERRCDDWWKASLVGAQTKHIIQKGSLSSITVWLPVREESVGGAARMTCVAPVRYVVVERSRNQ